LARKKKGAASARKAAGKPGKRKPGRPPNVGPKYDVLGLRKRIGKTHGVAQISREVLANLIGAAVGSIVNWERGMIPRASYVTKLKDLDRQNASGELRLTLPKRGRVPGSGKGAPRAAAAAPRTRSVFSGEPSNSIAVVYANQARLDRGVSESRIRFTLVLPGAREARAVADVVVPNEVISSFRQ
jgi:hypothetical protein